MAIVTNPDGTTVQIDDSTIQPIQKTGAIRSLGDTLLKFGRGGVGATKQAANVVGAGNRVSNALQSASDFIGSGLSDEAKFDEQVAAQRTKNAAGKGAMAEIGATLRNFYDNPIDTVAEGAGSIVPTAAAMIASRGKINPAAAGIGLGAVQGAGAVKGSIYDAVKQDATAKGLTEQQADKLATDAQAYSGQNRDQIALGAGLGAVAGATGAEATSLLTGSARETAKSRLRETLKGFATEGGTEAAQGGQEQYAANVARNRLGAGIDQFQGVAGQATAEGIAGGITGGAFSLADTFQAKEQLKSTILQQGNGGVISQAAATAVDTGAAQPVMGLPNYVGEPLVTFPDGTTMTRAEAQAKYTADELAQFEQRVGMNQKPEVAGLLQTREANPMIVFADGSTGTKQQFDEYLAGLPNEAERMKARARFLGYAPQQADATQEQTTPVSGLLQARDQDPMIVYPDGSTGKRSEFDGYINSLPEQQRVTEMARLLGYGPQQGGENATQQPVAEVAAQSGQEELANAQAGAGNELSNTGSAAGQSVYATTPSPGMRGDISIGTQPRAGADAGNATAGTDVASAQPGDVIELNGVRWRKLDNGGFEQVMGEQSPPVVNDSLTTEQPTTEQSSAVDAPNNDITANDAATSVFNELPEPTLREKIAERKAVKEDYGLANENAPNAKQQLQQTFDNSPDIGVPAKDGNGYSFTPPDWNELPNGFAFREYRVGNTAYQEVRAPKTGNVEPAVMRRMLNTETGKTAGALEATSTLSNVMSGQAFDVFNEYFGKKTEASNVKGELIAKTVSQPTQGAQDGRQVQGQETAQEVTGVRSVVEAIVKRRAAANQIGKGRAFNNYLDKAKRMMAGETLPKNTFKLAQAAFQDDKVLADQFKQLDTLMNKQPDMVDALPQAETAPSQQKEATEIEYKGVRISQIKVRPRNEGDEPRTMWAVETTENKERRLQGQRTIGGDALLDTIEEAKAEVDAMQAREKAKQQTDEADARKQAEKEKADQEAMAKKSDLDGFGDDLPQMRKALLVKNMDTPTSINGEVLPLRDHVRKLVANGGKPFTYQENAVKGMTKRQYNQADNRAQAANDKRVAEGGKKTVYAIQMPDESMYELGKNAHDFAQYLVEKNKPASETVKVKDKFGRTHTVRKADLENTDLQRIPTVRANGDVVVGEEIPRDVLNVDNQTREQKRANVEAEVYRQAVKAWDDVTGGQYQSDKRYPAKITVNDKTIEFALFKKPNSTVLRGERLQKSIYGYFYQRYEFKESGLVETGSQNFFGRDDDQLNRVIAEYNDIFGEQIVEPLPVKQKNIAENAPQTDEQVAQPSTSETQPEQTEPTPAEEPTQEAAAAEEFTQTETNNLKDTSDVGGELGYNRRNKFISKQDIENANNDTERVQLAVKSKLWPKPDYQQLVDDGVTPVIAHVVKQVYDSLSTKPAFKGEQMLYDYVDTVESARDAVNEILADKKLMDGMIVSIGVQASKRSSVMSGNRTAELAEFAKLGEAFNGSDPLNYIVDKVFPKNEKGARWGRQNDKGNNRANATGNKFYKALQLNLNTFIDALKAVEDGFPAKKEQWQISYRIEPKDGKFELIKKGRYTPTSTHDTEEQAIEAAKELTKRNKDADFEEPETLVQEGMRNGKPIRTGNVSSDELKNTIGLRAVNFGNWMSKSTNAKERQMHVNAAFDAFHDLADILNLPIKAMALDGKLGLAIGAQGTGRYAAHFVPGFNEINLTRTRGAGSLAHEWAHALDHYFGVQAGLASSDDPFASWLGKYPNTKTDGAEIRPEIAQAFKTIYDTMKSKAEDAESARERHKKTYEASKERLEKYINEPRAMRDGQVITMYESVEKLVKGDEKAENALKEILNGNAGKSIKYGKGSYRIGRTKFDETLYENVATIANKLGWTYKEAQDLNSLSGAFEYSKELYSKEPEQRQIHTDFYRSASVLDANKTKNYWATPHELFARAFEMYVADKLAEQSNENRYLVAAWKLAESADVDDPILKAIIEQADKRYPRGEERKAINKAFDTLISEIKTKETDNGNVAMFSRTQRSDLAPQSDLDALATLFTELETDKKLRKLVADRKVDKHPMADEIKRVDRDFYDIIGQLEDEGRLKINCKD